MLVYRFPSISGRRLKRRFRKVKATEAIRSNNLLDNAAIAELLIREAETASGHRKLAFWRAAREAFIWPEEAAHIASRPQLSSRHRFVASLSRSLKPAGF